MKKITVKGIFLFIVIYLGLQCLRGSLWIPFGISVLITIFILLIKPEKS